MTIYKHIFSLPQIHNTENTEVFLEGFEKYNLLTLKLALRLSTW